jgi:hypothetical protein
MDWISQGFYVCLVLLGICLALPALSFVFGWGRKHD